MLFFKSGGDASVSRRNAKVWSLRLRKAVVVGVLLVIVAGSGAYGYHSGSFETALTLIKDKILVQTAKAGFKVNAVLLSGRNNIPQQDIAGHLQHIRKDMPLFGVSVADTQKTLSEISWVKNVLVSRQWPNTLVIEIEERIPVAQWQYQKKLSLIDIEGHVLDTNDMTPWQHLPLIVGKEAPQHVQEALNFLTAEPLLAEHFTAAVRASTGRWDLVLQNNLTIKLPAQNAELALRRMALLQEQNDILNKNLKVIDLRLPDKMIVQQNTSSKDKA